jgi:hypothetical protein
MSDASKPASAKKSKTAEDAPKYEVGEVVLCKVKGFPAWYVAMAAISAPCTSPTRRLPPLALVLQARKGASRTLRNAYIGYRG